MVNSHKYELKKKRDKHNLKSAKKPHNFFVEIMKKLCLEEYAIFYLVVSWVFSLLIGIVLEEKSSIYDSVTKD